MTHKVGNEDACTLERIELIDVEIEGRRGGRKRDKEREKVGKRVSERERRKIGISRVHDEKRLVENKGNGWNDKGQIEVELNL